MKNYKEMSKIKHGAPTSEVGLTKSGEIIVGKFVDRERVDYDTAMREHLQQRLGSKFIPAEAPVCS
jgi:2-oxoglutarate ferredoxin oxidoreductase subunit beta